MDLVTCLQILSLIPPLQFGTPVAVTPAPEGTGTLLVTACDPGQGVMIRPGNYPAIAGKDGTVRVKVPAQAASDASYRVVSETGDVPIHGTLNANETLSGVCP